MYLKVILTIWLLTFQIAIIYAIILFLFFQMWPHFMVSFFETFPMV
jgi:hypothetical protein